MRFWASRSRRDREELEGKNSLPLRWQSPAAAAQGGFGFSVSGAIPTPPGCVSCSISFILGIQFYPSGAGKVPVKSWEIYRSSADLIPGFRIRAVPCGTSPSRLKTSQNHQIIEYFGLDFWIFLTLWASGCFPAGFNPAGGPGLGSQGENQSHSWFVALGIPCSAPVVTEK